LHPKQKWQNLVILTGSVIFYAAFDVPYTFLLAISIVIDYWISVRLMEARTPRKWLLVLSLVINVGIWGFFKYSHTLLSLFLENPTILSPGISQAGFSLIVPIGLSFYTLKKIAYILDVYDQTIQPTKNLVEYACFVAFFPQIIAGPIDRAQSLIPQFQKKRSWNKEYFMDAWPLIITGLFKKIVIADGIGIIVDQVYLTQLPSKLLWLVGTMGFVVQLLADFSGYTDISRGVARLFGFYTAINFNAPYLSKNIIDFWRRWHITLSDWLRIYVFFPISRFLRERWKNERTLLNILIPTLITMLVSGLWHGTGWNFILWGILHGVWITFSQINHQGGLRVKIHPTLAWLLNMTFLVISWGVFRASSLQWMGMVLFDSSWINGSTDLSIIISVLSFVLFYSALSLIEFAVHRRGHMSAWISPLFYACITILIFIYSNSATPDFIYTHF